MASKRTKPITLGGDTYTIHALTIDELERVTDILREFAGTNKLAFQILRIALERAEPKVENAGAIELTMPELLEASKTILELAGVPQNRAGDENPTGQMDLLQGDAAA